MNKLVKETKNPSNEKSPFTFVIITGIFYIVSMGIANMIY